MSDKTTIVNLADEHQGHQNQYRLYFLRLLSKVKFCLVFNNRYASNFTDTHRLIFVRSSYFCIN